MAFFTTSLEIEGVLRESAVQALQEVTLPLENALEFLRREAPARYLVPSVQHIVISQVTAAALFESLWSVDRDKAPEIARTIGENAGLRFADSLWEWLTKIGQIPGDDRSLVELWTKIDSSANWGQMTFSKHDDELVIYVEDSFLIRSLGARHEYCAFMEGYVFGFLWASVKELHHRLKGAGRATNAASIKGGHVTRQCAGDHCAFALELQADPLARAYEELMIARHQIRIQPELIDAQVAPLRRSLEFGLKGKLGLPETERWEPWIRACRKVLNYGAFLRPIKTAETVYAELSGQTHANVAASLTADRVKELANDVARVLRYLEHVVIPQDKDNAIREEIGKKAPAPRQPDEQ